MLFLTFQVGVDRYALEAAQVSEVLALVDLVKIPGAPVGTAGQFTYRGQPVPVLDLCTLALGRPSSHRLSTRLLLLRHAGHPLGLLVEHATELVRKNLSDFIPTGSGLLTQDQRGSLRLFQLDQLLTPELRDLLAIFHFTQTLDEPVAA